MVTQQDILNSLKVYVKGAQSVHCCSFALSIRNNHNIKGINVDNEIFKICQLADDTTLFIEDLNALETAITFLMTSNTVQPSD